MTRASQIMTRDVAYMSPDDSLLAAARIMAERDIGALPICHEGRLVGVLTDRDIAVRCAASNQLPSEAKARDAMTDNIRWCYEDDSVEAVKNKMEAAQVRRLPIIDRDRRLVGIVSLGDVARRAGDAQHTLAGVSQPASGAH